MKIPSLKSKDCVTILSPAKAIGEEEVLFAKSLWEARGFRVKLAPHVTEKNNYFAGTPSERAADFKAALLDDETKAIICSRGGYGCIQLLDLLDYQLFIDNPKWIIGFSDVTVFHFLQNKLGIPSIHATMPLNYKENSPDSISNLVGFLTSSKYAFSWSSDIFNSGTVNGELVGGNLSVISDLIGTELMPNIKGKILFLEEVAEHLYVIDRMLYQLFFAGVLNQISGIIIGDFSDIKDTHPKFGKSLKDIILKHIKPLGIPYIFDFPAGHCSHNLPIVFGVDATLTISEIGETELKTR